MTRAATARLFLAIDPPAEVCEELAAWARAAVGPRARAVGRRTTAGESGARRPLRLLAPDLLHLTLCFLGARPVAEIDELIAGLGDCSGSVGELSVGAPLWLPPRRPHALAVEVHDPDGDLAQLHGVASGVLHAGLHAGHDAHQDGAAQDPLGRGAGRRSRP